MKWYEKVNFYDLRLTNNDWLTWTTPLSFEEVKNEIGNKSFVKVSYKDGKQTEINTKVIKSIEDTTEERRTSMRNRDQDNQMRYKIVQEIRSIPLKKFTKWKLGLLKKYPDNYEFDWYDKDIGTDKDYLMKYNERYLNELLDKCKDKIIL